MELSCIPGRLKCILLWGYTYLQPHTHLCKPTVPESLTSWLLTGKSLTAIPFLGLTGLKHFFPCSIFPPAMARWQRHTSGSSSICARPGTTAKQLPYGRGRTGAGCDCCFGDLMGTLSGHCWPCLNRKKSLGPFLLTN